MIFSHLILNHFYIIIPSLFIAALGHAFVPNSNVLVMERYKDLSGVSEAHFDRVKLTSVPSQSVIFRKEVLTAALHALKRFGEEANYTYFYENDWTDRFGRKQFYFQFNQIHDGIPIEGTRLSGPCSFCECSI